ncbi:MAG: DMT family transporter [Nitrospirota bacterium]|jgi:drug/metabolite transporter (DMT)-like permease
MDSLWVYLALTCAFTNATSDALLKRSLTPNNELLLAWLKLGIALPPLYLALWVATQLPDAGLPAPSAAFFRAIAISLPLEVLALVLYTKALRLSPLGLTIPFLSLTPLFLILFAYVIAGQRVSLRGAGGIILIAAGSYLLNLPAARGGMWAPFRAIAHEPGSRLMIAVAAIYAITSSLGKVAITASSPLFFGATYFTALFVAFTPVAVRGAAGSRPHVDRRLLSQALAPGLLYGVMMVTHTLSMGLANVAYMIAVKRTSLLMAVGYGYFLFHEGHLRDRLAGAGLMFAGLVLIVTAG